MDREIAIQSDANGQARPDRAAVYRLVAQHGWGDVIFNHAATRGAFTPSDSLIKRHEPLSIEAWTASLVEVSMDDGFNQLSGVNRPSFTLHSGILHSQPDLHCSVRRHPDQGVAVYGPTSGLRSLSQNAIRFHHC